MIIVFDHNQWLNSILQFASMELSVVQAKTSLISVDHDIITHNKDRSCSDILCLFLFIVFAALFVGLLIYGLAQGKASQVFSVYNSNQIRCDMSTFPYGYFPEQSITKAICVLKCPKSAELISCLPDKVNCLNGTFANKLQTFDFDNICIPDGKDISSFFNYNAYVTWSYDLQKGYLVLVGAAIVAMLASLCFLVVVRCCTGFIIGLVIIICISGLLVMGIFFILEAKGVHISAYLNDTVNKISYNSLIIIGSGMIIVAVLVLLLVICLRKRIALGSKSVELGAVFLLQNCCMVILPITQAILIAAAIAAIVIGSVCILSLGQYSFPNNNAFPTISLSNGNIIMISFFLAGGFWVMLYFHGCNHFMLSSAVAIWYFNYQSHFAPGSPFCDSLRRLIRYNTGSVACTALINGIFFIFKIITHIFSFEAKEDDHRCIAYFLKCLNCLFCIFRIFLRFLAEGTYVQIAVTGKGYCHSTIQAFNIIADNGAKIVITESISLFFTVLGIFGISVAVSVAAYFVCLHVQYFATILTDPMIVTIVSGLIGFVIACIYLSMIDLSAQSVLQCYLIDHVHHDGSPKYANPKITQILITPQK